MQRLERTMAAVYGNNNDKERPDLKFRRMRRQQTIAARSLQRIYRQHMSESPLEAPWPHPHTVAMREGGADSLAVGGGCFFSLRRAAAHASP